MKLLEKGQDRARMGNNNRGDMGIEDIDQETHCDGLVAYTDAVIEDRPGDVRSMRRPEFADTVDLLARTISHQPVPDRLRQNVKRQVNDEWAAKNQKKGRFSLYRLFGSSRRRMLFAATAALLLLVVATLLISTPYTPIHGTAGGDIGLVFVLTVTIVALIGFLIVLLIARQ